MRRLLPRIALTLTLGLAGLLVLEPRLSAQGPFTAQIQRALDNLIATANSWTATNTFTNIVVTGTCTGCTAGNAPVDATFITQIPNATLTNEQALSTLATGILKSTTATGVVSIAAAGTDYLAPTGSGTGLVYTTGSITGLGGNFSTVGAFTLALTVTNNTTVTLPVSGTLQTTTGTPAGFVIASQATGDLLYASSASAWSRLGIGASTTALVGGTIPAWTNTPTFSPAGLIIASQAAGDILYASSATAWVRLAKGSDTQILTLAAGVPSWAAPAAGTLSGTTLAAGVVTSSLTAVGTIATGVWNAGAVTSSGLATFNGAGVNNFGASTNGDQAIAIDNTSTGAAAASYVRVKGGTASGYLTTFGSGYTTSGTAIQGSLRLYQDGVGGISLVADNASGPIRFYPGGGGQQEIFAADGSVTFSGVTGTGTIADVVCMTSGGQLIKSAAATCVISSERYKHDIQAFNGDALGMLRQLQTVSYYLNDHEDRGHRLGLIAERANAIRLDPSLPKDFTLVTREEDGRIGGLQYEAITTLNTRAIQQLEKRIAALEGGTH